VTEPALRVVQLLAPAAVGGAETVVAALTEGLRRRGHSVVVGAVVDPGVRTQDHPFLRRIAETGADLRVLPVKSRQYLRERALVSDLLRGARPQVFHSHGYRPDLLDAPMAARMGIPTVTTVHGFTRGGGKNRLYEALQRRAFRRFDAVVAVSLALGGELAESGVAGERLHVVPNALPPLPDPLDSADARARLGVASADFHLAWIGRVSEEKGPDVLLAALRLLPGGGWTASVVGDGPLASPLRAASAGGGPIAVRWHGVIDGISRYLTGVDCLVMSSRTEGTPIVLLEAMARGVPVVATAVGGIPEVAEGVALLVSPDDPRALADAIGRVRRDPALRRRLRAAGLERIRARYQPEAWLEGYERVYRGLLAGRSGFGRDSPERAESRPP
jgi:glycosyltransferase involved in cell wall biosynthesis